MFYEFDSAQKPHSFSHSETSPFCPRSLPRSHSHSHSHSVLFPFPTMIYVIYMIVLIGINASENCVSDSSPPFSFSFCFRSHSHSHSHSHSIPTTLSSPQFFCSLFGYHLLSHNYKLHWPIEATSDFAHYSMVAMGI